MEKEFNPLYLEAFNISDSFLFQDGQKEIIKSIIEWRAEPPLAKTGRSSFLAIADENLPFNGIKIKGCGYFDLQKQTTAQPSTEEGYDAHLQNAPDGIKEVHYQIEVDENDELKYSVPMKRPYGAQLYEKAKHEFKVNEKLFNEWKDDINNYPFYFPIGYAKYKDLKYKDESLGVTVLGMHLPTETPLGLYFQGHFEEKGLRINPYILEYWKEHVSVVGKNKPDYFDLLKALKKLCYEFGKSLSYLHDHFVDFDSHFFNATVNTKTGGVILYDFDHVLDACEISDQRYFYYALKDFEIGLVAVLSNFMLSGLVEGIVLFEKMDEKIFEYNIIEGFYEGYFGKLSEKAKEHSKSMWERMLLFALNKILKSQKHQHIHLAYAFCEQEREKSYIDVFGYLLSKIQNKRSSFALTQEKHRSIISKFLKQKQDLTKLHQNVT